MAQESEDVDLNGLTGENLDRVLQTLTSAESIAKIANSISPEMADKVKGMQLNPADMKKVREKIAKKGISPSELRKAMSSQKKAKALQTNLNPVMTYQAIYINPSRVIKSIKVPQDDPTDFITKTLGGHKDIDSYRLSRLSVGPWKDQRIFIWHDKSKEGVVNKKIKKLLGITGLSQIIITSNVDLTIDDFNSVTALLSK